MLNSYLIMSCLIQYSNPEETPMAPFDQNDSPSTQKRELIFMPQSGAGILRARRRNVNVARRNLEARCILGLAWWSVGAVMAAAIVWTIASGGATAHWGPALLTILYLAWIPGEVVGR